MSSEVSSNSTTEKRGAIRAIIIAGVAAFAFGLLSAFIYKAIAASPGAPIASSESVPFTM
jgi:hypothetical protein